METREIITWGIGTAVGLVGLAAAIVELMKKVKSGAGSTQTKPDPVIQRLHFLGKYNIDRSINNATLVLTGSGAAATSIRHERRIADGLW